MFALLIIFILMGALFMGLGWPLWRGRIKPNSWYGLRVGETLNDERVWYPANSYSGRDMVVLGVGMVVLAVVLFVVPGMNEDLYGMGLSILITVGSLVMAARGIVVARRLAASFKEQDSDRVT